MLDQSFSLVNLEKIFNMENRKGNIDLHNMPDDYQYIIKKIKENDSSLKELRKIQKRLILQEQKEEIDLKKAYLKELRDNRQDCLLNFFSKMSAQINSSKFRIKLSKFELDGKEVFEVDDVTYTSQFVIKQLLINLHKTFKVKQANRHAILSNIKDLLNSRIPVYVIRTDVSHFYESIPQDRLFAMLGRDSLLSYKSKSLIKGIFNEYERIKDINKVPTHIGVPRGIGISAYLSELYMRDIDSQIRNRPEVMFYARYVDDIFIILSCITEGGKIEDYYDDIVNLFKDFGLSLKSPSDTSNKCKLLDLMSKQEVDAINMDYLGYKLNISKNKENRVQTIFSLSDKKKDQYKERIDKAFKHLELYSVSNIKMAYRDFFDCLKFIIGNYKLYKSKANIKVGLYYNNDLLNVDETDDLDELTSYLRNKEIKLYAKLNHTDRVKLKIVQKLNKIDFKKSWKQRKTFSLSLNRLKDLETWL